MEFKGFIISSILLGLFIFAMIQGFTYLAVENDVSNPLRDNEAINSTVNELETELEDLDNSTQDIRDAFTEDKTSVETGFLLLGSIIDAGTNLGGILVTIYKLSLGLIAETLGVSSLVFAVMVAILLITLILLAWSLYKSGR